MSAFGDILAVSQAAEDQRWKAVRDHADVLEEPLTAAVEAMAVVAGTLGALGFPDAQIVSWGAGTMAQIVEALSDGTI